MFWLILSLLGVVTNALNFTIISEPTSVFEVSNHGISCSAPCDLPVKESLFEVRARSDASFQELLMYGFYGGDGEAGNYTTYTGSRRQLQMVMKNLELEYDSMKGIVVVGLDISDNGSNMPHSLKPAVGASVKNLSGVSSADGFIYRGMKPVFGTEIVEGGSSFVTFANVQLSEEVSVSVSPPDNMACALGPAGVGGAKANYASIAVTKDVISVVAFICSEK